MRSPSKRLWNQTITVERNDWVADSAGGRSRVPVAVPQLIGTIQPVSAQRTPDHLRATGEIDTMALFGHDPEVLQDDVLVGPGNVRMVVKAPAIDEGGRGACWTVYGQRQT